MLECDFCRWVRLTGSGHLLSSSRQSWLPAQRPDRHRLMTLDQPHSWWMFLPWPTKHNIRGCSDHDSCCFKPRHLSLARGHWWACWLRKDGADRDALQATSRFLRHLRNYQRHLYERRPTHSHARASAAGGTHHGCGNRWLSPYSDSRRCFDELVGDCGDEPEISKRGNMFCRIGW